MAVSPKTKSLAGFFLKTHPESAVRELAGAALRQTGIVGLIKKGATGAVRDIPREAGRSVAANSIAAFRSPVGLGFIRAFRGR